MTLKQRTPMQRSTGLTQGGQLARSSSPMRRTEMNRGTSSLRTTKPMSRGTSQLSRGLPLKTKPPSMKAPAEPKIAKTGPVEKAAPARKRGLKSSRPKMTPIRASAKDEECTLRFPCCNYRTDTTVLCHRNGAGAGMKAEDTDAAYGCDPCHRVFDGRAPRPEGFTRDMMLARFDIAVELTHIRLAVKGLIAATVATNKGHVEKQKPIPARNRDRLQLESTDRAVNE
jgi:hypothetical protein